MIHYTHTHILSIVERFNSATLPKTEWTHDAHCIVALWYLSHYEYYDAVCRIKSGIIALNNSQHTLNTATSGYHETITLFWSKVVEIYSKSNQQAEFVELVNGFLHSPLANNNLPFEFYEKDYLLSAPLRCMYYAPNKKAIDTATLQDIVLRNV